MKRAIPIVILLAAAVAAGLYYYPRLTRKSAPANQLSLSGNIEAHESLVGFKVAGRIVDLPVEEGQQVQQGALLARLDDADYQQKVRIDQAAMGVRSSDLALTLAGTRQQEVKAAQQTMIDAQADLDQKNLDNQRARQHEYVPAPETVAGAIRKVADVGIEQGIHYQAGRKADSHQGRRQAHHGVVEKQHEKAGQDHQDRDGHLPHTIEQLDEERHWTQVRDEGGGRR